MNYREQNKAAWEEAFQHRYPNWGEDNYLRLLNEDFPFLTSDILKELRQIEYDIAFGDFYNNKGIPIS